MSKNISLSEYAKILDEAIKDVDKAVGKINEELEKTYQRDIEENIIKQSIQAFYDDYTSSAPKGGYKRRKDLFNAYSFSSKGAQISIETSHKFMKKKHRAPHEYIYNLAFVNGWHGGAVNIDPNKEDDWGIHPNPITSFNKIGDETYFGEGTPYWRTPPKTWEYWGEPSQQSTSPLENITIMLKEYEEKKMKKRQAEAIEKGLRNLL